MENKETIEEAAERIFNIPDDKKGDVYFGSNIAHLRKGFKFGAKWQKEKIYNQIKQLYDNENITSFSKRAYAQCLDIIEQFKNK